MTTNYLKLILYTLLLILLQVVVFNKLHLFQVATPYLYIYTLIKFPTGMSRSLVLICCFIIGFVLDIFADTPGLNAGVLTLVGMTRPVWMNLFLPKDILESYIPSVRMVGRAPFWRYAFSIILLHHFILMLVEMFSFIDFGFLLLRILA
ncbi:MAG: rod shape-determining protein MreD, partial [Bacteroidales bacterium]|nr:rod shape-determining protein MreD [Bacteroidales bacterium]